MPKYTKVNITKDDLRKIIYFILMKFRSDPLHHQGTSVKRDLIGGYIERWFNKIAETVIFDNLLKNKKYSVVSDYFLYGNDSEKNAPDIIGIKTNKNKNIPFIQYNNGRWESVEKMPKIEVKVIRKDQWLLGVREPQMVDDYYVFIESDLKGDYLTAIFEEDVFNSKYFKELIINSDYVANDENNLLIKQVPMKKTEQIGTMRLIGTYSKNELRKNTTLCKKKISPYYFSNVENVKRITQPSSDNKLLNIDTNGVASYNGPNKKDVYLPFSIFAKNNTTPKLIIKKMNKGSVYLKSETQLSINGETINSGLIKINFKKFERSSSWNENIASKYMLEHYGNDSTRKLVSEFDIIYSKNK